MTDSKINIVPLERSHAAAAAELHRVGIDTGFLSSLGAGFLTQLYRAIPSCGSGFGFAAVDEEGRVCGFIACSESTGRLYKQVMMRRGLMVTLPILKYMLRPAFVKRMWATLRYPSQVDPSLPAAEVLSIAVDGTTRGKGVGKKLISAAFDEFRRRGIECVKVAVWDGNEGANAFYKNCGFALAFTKMHHGLKMNIYSIRINHE